jgi:peroxiredoxin/Spy/CpxP family protein refolding chaperone
MRQYLLAAGLWMLVVASGKALAESPAADDAYWNLLHEDAVADDLKLTATQRTKLRGVLDELDLKVFPLRNRSQEEGGPIFTKVVADARPRVAAVLKPDQQSRLEKLVARKLGMAALQQEPIAKSLGLTSDQRAKIDEAIATAQSALKKLRESAKGRSVDELNAEATKIQIKERDEVVAVLSDAQKRKLSSLIAIDFDLGRLGQTKFKVPELVGNASAWRNSPPISLAQQRGKVVVVHYFACGCINCIHNYPVYREWRQELAGKNVTLIGIHTPETKTERDIAHLERKLKEDDLAFPVLIDNDGANWNAWGNSMWPSVYIIDKQGYLRHFWAGELKWEGAKGDEIAMEWIERLLKE